MRSYQVLFSFFYCRFTSFAVLVNVRGFDDALATHLLVFLSSQESSDKNRPSEEQEEIENKTKIKCQILCEHEFCNHLCPFLFHVTHK